MFQIILNNEVIGFADKPVYVKKKDGIWINCKGAEAEAIAFESVAYEGAVAKEVESYLIMDEKNASVEQALTDIEITQIEDEQMLTDHDIAIMELQSREV